MVTDKYLLFIVFVVKYVNLKDLAAIMADKWLLSSVQHIMSFVKSFCNGGTQTASLQSLTLNVSIEKVLLQ